MDKRTMAFEMLVLLSILAAVTFVFRIWILLIPILVAIVFNVVLLLYLSVTKTEAIERKPATIKKRKTLIEKDVYNLAYTVIQKRVKEFVKEAYPNASWIWEQADVKKRIASSQDIHIILNKAGGFKRAKVIIENLQAVGLEFLAATIKPLKTERQEDSAAKEKGEVDLVENFELLAYEWVNVHILDLNERCNETIGRGETELILTAEELPDRKSWTDICRELKHSEIHNLQIVQEGIKIILQ